MVDMEIRALPEYQYLIKELGSEDVVKEEINTLIEKFQGLMQFEAGVYQKAVEHGWKPPAKAVPQISHFSEEYLETRNWRWNKDRTKSFTSLSVTAKVIKIGPLDAYEYEDQRGNLVIQRYVDVTLEDYGVQEVVRMKDLSGFTSRSGKNVAASAMATLWHNLRAAEGRSVKISGIQVMQSITFDGEKRYDFSSGNFTRVEKVLDDDTVTEDNFKEDF